MRYWDYREDYWMLYRRTLGSERHRYAVALPDKLGTGTMTCGGLNTFMDAAAEIGSTTFSLSVEMSRLTRDGTAEPVSRGQILRRK